MRHIILVTFRTKPHDREIILGKLEGIAEAIFLYGLDKLPIEIIQKATIIFTGSGLDLKPEILARAKNLKMIQTLSAGVDTLPFEKIPRNVIVCSNAGGNAIVVAEHAFAMILAATRKITYHNGVMRSGIWQRRRYGILLHGKTLGILGLGNVGREIARIGKCFGMRIYAINRSGKTTMDIDFIGTPKDLDFVLRNSDIVVISLPLNKYTRGIIGERELKLMKKNAILVNVSRGAIIDQKALYNHLRENTEFTACLDVWWKYPPRGSDKCFQDYPFHELPNVIMTPHIAGFSEEIRTRVLLHALENILRFIRGEKPINIVDRDEYA